MLYFHHYSQLFLLLVVVCFLNNFPQVSSGDWDELLLQDPSLWPGHLEPFGVRQRTSKLEELHSWPDPLTFFKEYVDKSRPVLFKGLAKQSPGYLKFEDEYFKNAPQADTTEIYAEPEVKENRTKPGYTITIKEFIERYHNETLYMVNELPKQFSSDVRIPAPIRCEKELMRSQVTWFSSGGTKSVLHNDDVDNINCLFRGSKELWMIEYSKNKLFVPIDIVQGGYSSMDVEKVNYTKFPELRKVDMYYKAVMEEGDCFFIPYHWFHQVNSFASDKGTNLAVNIWFTHVLGHKPQKCDIPESDATVDKYIFPDDEKERETEKSVMDYFTAFLSKKKSISVSYFLKLLKYSDLVNPTKHKFKGIPMEFHDIGKEIFNIVDGNRDGKWTPEDLDKINEMGDEEAKLVDDSLKTQIAYVEDYIEDLVEESNQAKLATDSSDEVTKDEL